MAGLVDLNDRFGFTGKSFFNMLALNDDQDTPVICMPRPLGAGETRDEETHREKETCPKGNVCVMHLKEHTKTCGATSSFQCSTCEKIFKQKRYLAQHMLTHLPSKQYECQKCHKSFKHRASGPVCIVVTFWTLILFPWHLGYVPF